MQTDTILNKRYRIVGLLAEGGMARVYRAHDTTLDRPVAVKVLREQYASDCAFLDRFQQEARAAAALSHPNIVGVYDVGTEGGVNYIVMELVEGSNLKEVILREGPLSPARAIDLTLQVLEALSAAHQRGIVHRDVKPQNILVSAQGHVKVADFGIAQAAKASHLTETGIVMGSVHYCAPEQAMGKGTSQSSDVYAVGVVLYEMLAGHLPFESDNALGVALKHIQEAPPSLRQSNPSVAPGLEGIVLRAMAKEPSQRYESADDMLRSLQAYRRLGEQATASFVAVAPRPSAAVQGPPPPIAAARPAVTSRVAGHATLPAKRRTFDWLVVLFSVLILGMIAAWLPLAARLYDVYFRPVPAAPTAAPSPSRGPAPAVVPSPQATVSPTTRVIVVPNLVGLTYTKAQSELEARDLEISMAADDSDVFPAGIIMTQTVPADQSVAPATVVGVVVSRGPKGIRVPSVATRPYSEAKARLEQLGLRVEPGEQQYSDHVPKDAVVSQNPPAESIVTAGTVVSLALSRGPRPPTPQPVPPTSTPVPDPRPVVPNLIRQPEAEARAAIDAAGLNNTYTNYQELKDVTPANRDFFLSIPVGHVVSQTPAAGTRVEPGRTVFIAVRRN